MTDDLALPTVATDLREANHMPNPPSENSGDIRAGWTVVALFFGVFLGFAFFIRLDAAAYAEGVVRVAGSRQVVQHRDGGIVTALHVREGQHVRAGDILIELGGAEVAANERALAGQVIGLQAERSRLTAEQSGAREIATPPSFARLAGEDRQLASAAMLTQRNALQTRREAISAQKRVLRQQAAQLRERIVGINKQMVENRTQVALFDDQVASIKFMVDKGYASLNRLRELQRARAGASSENASFAASKASADQQIRETEMQALALDSTNQQQISEDLRRNEAALTDALPKWEAVREQLRQTHIRAPVTGQVVALSIFTVAGVIAPGQKLLEIVPDAAPLEIEARINPMDADDVHVGQKAEVRFSALQERDLPVFEGELTRVSADTLVDERTGAHYYTGTVIVRADDYEKIRQAKGGDDGLKAGLPVQVLVPLRRRTLFQYLLEPLNQVLWRSGREH